MDFGLIVFLCAFLLVPLIAVVCLLWKSGSPPHELPKETAVLAHVSGEIRKFTAPERILINKGVSPYNCIQEYEFIRKIVLWDKETIDSLYYALQVAHKIGAVDFIEENKDAMLVFIRGCYSQKGGFKIGIDDALPVDLTIHSTHCGLGALKYLQSSGSVSSAEMGGKILGSSALEGYLGEGSVDSLYRFLNECKLPLGFKESPDPEGRYFQPTITDSASAAWILRQVMPETTNCQDHLREHMSGELTTFIEKLKDEGNPEAPNDVGTLAFRNKLGMREKRWLCSTYYAFRLLNDLAIVNEKLDDEEKMKILNFIIRCQNEDGGFGPNYGETSNIIHTKNAVSLVFKRLTFKNDVHSKALNKTKNAVAIKVAKYLERSCFNKIFAFGCAEYYQPNMYAMSLGLDIMDYIGIDVDDETKVAVQSFLEMSFNKDTGGVVGYMREGEFVNHDSRSYLLLDDDFKYHQKLEMRKVEVMRNPKTACA